jgi:TatD DNase family protein
VIDTHAHLDACAEPVDVLIARAREAGVTRIISVGTSPGSWRTILPIAESNEGVFLALGIHPHEAGDAEPALEELPTYLAHPKTVAVGEIGLDYYRDYAPREAQVRVFEAQLELARRLQKPVVIHNRAADEATAALLREHGGTVVLHCFSSPSLLDPAIEHGWYVSFAGNVTYKSAYDLRAAARAVPTERLLAETDSPYLAPQPRRGRPNEPANVLHTVGALAEARGEDADELAARIEANAVACFSLP